MTLLTNSFEGGTSGTTITTANSGGGADSAFDVVNIPTSATAAFDNAHAAHGSLSGKLATGATAGNVYAGWTTSMGTQATAWFRVYLYFTANPSATQRVAGFLAGASVSASFAVNSTGKVLALNAAGSTVTTSTTSIPLNQWFRLEGFATGSATVGQTEVKIFLTADSSTPDETDTSAANLNTTGSHTVYRFGHAVGSAIANLGPWWMDDLGLSSTGYIGPAVTVSYLPGAARRIPARTPALPPVRRFRALMPPPQMDAPFPVAEIRQQRQPRGMQPRRPHQFAVVPPQLNPPYPFTETAQHRETWPRGAPRRGRQASTVPEQVNPFTEIVQRRQAWARGLPRRGRQANVVPPQVNPPFLFTELRQWRQPRGFWPRRGHGFTPVPAQQAAAPNPAWVPQSLRHVRVPLPLRRRVLAAVPAAQDLPLQASRHVRPALLPRRGHPVPFLLSQDDVPRQRAAIRPRIPRPRAGRITWLPQQAAVPAPAWVPQLSRRARLLLPLRRRLPVVPPAAQDLPLQSSRHARLFPPPRRTRPAWFAPPQGDLPRQRGPARPRAPWPRRGRVTWPPQQQAAAPAPAWVQDHRAPLRAIAFIRRRFLQLLPWPQAAPPAGPSLDEDDLGGVITAVTPLSGQIAGNTPQAGSILPASSYNGAVTAAPGYSGLAAAVTPYGGSAE